MFFDERTYNEVVIAALRSREFCCRRFGDYEAAVVYQRQADLIEAGEHFVPGWRGIDRQVVFEDDPRAYVFRWRVTPPLIIELTRNEATNLVGAIMGHYGWDLMHRKSGWVIGVKSEEE